MFWMIVFDGDYRDQHPDDDHCTKYGLSLRSNLQKSASPRPSVKSANSKLDLEGATLKRLSSFFYRSSSYLTTSLTFAAVSRCSAVYLAGDGIVNTPTVTLALNNLKDPARPILSNFGSYLIIESSTTLFCAWPLTQKIQSLRTTIDCEGISSIDTGPESDCMMSRRSRT